MHSTQKRRLETMGSEIGKISDEEYDLLIELLYGEKRM